VDEMIYELNDFRGLY